jgi:plasmid stability protein
MATITLKNIPDDLYQQLKYAAKAHHRSINSEIISYLENTLRPAQIHPADRLDRIRRVRPKAGSEDLTAEEIRNAIDDGRP